MTVRWLIVLLLLLAAVPADAAPRSVHLEELTWTELRDAIAAGATTAIIPAGGTEQNGPHMVLGKHNVRVRILAGRIAEKLGDAIVAPVIAYVPEGAIDPPQAHMKFPGTLTVPEPVFEKVLEFAAASLRHAGFKLIVLVGDHGSYQQNLAAVAGRLTKAWVKSGTRVVAIPEYYRASQGAFADTLKANGAKPTDIGTHAALADTSLSLALDPALVRPEVLAAGRDFDPAHGVYGGVPTDATAALGDLGVNLILEQTVAAIRRAQRR